MAEKARMEAKLHDRDRRYSNYELPVYGSLREKQMARYFVVYALSLASMP